MPGTSEVDGFRSAPPRKRGGRSRFSDSGRGHPALVYDWTDRMANTQSNVPDTDPHSTSSTYQSLARPAHRRIASMVAIQMWHDFTVLIRPRANIFEKLTSQNWPSSTCSHA